MTTHLPASGRACPCRLRFDSGRRGQATPLAAAVVLVGFALLPKVAATAEPLRSGLAPGEHVTTVFEPVNVNGEFANEPHCLVCENGLNPAVMVFARDLDDSLGKLLLKLEAVAKQSSGRRLGAFVVFTSDEAPLEQRLQQFAERHKLQHLILAMEPDPTVPRAYKIAPDAAVTAMWYVRHEVRATHALRAGELTEEAVEQIAADVSKVLPKN